MEGQHFSALAALQAPLEALDQEVREDAKWSMLHRTANVLFDITCLRITSWKASSGFHGHLLLFQAASEDRRTWRILCSRLVWNLKSLRAARVSAILELTQIFTIGTAFASTPSNASVFAQNRPAFGAPATSSSGGGLFGGGTATAGSSGGFSGFGTNNTNNASGGGLFGQGAQKPAFGSGNTGSGLFGTGNTGGGFGQNNSQTSGAFSTPILGQNAECQGTGVTPFQPFTEKEGAGSATNHFQSISCMESYKPFSFEVSALSLLRADVMLTRNRNYEQQTTMAGGALAMAAGKLERLDKRISEVALVREIMPSVRAKTVQAAAFLGKPLPVRLLPLGVLKQRSLALVRAAVDSLVIRISQLPVVSLGQLPQVEREIVCSTTQAIQGPDLELERPIPIPDLVVEEVFLAPINNNNNNNNNQSHYLATVPPPPVGALGLAELDLALEMRLVTLEAVSLATTNLTLSVSLSNNNRIKRPVLFLPSASHRIRTRITLPLHSDLVRLNSRSRSPEDYLGISQLLIQEVAYLVIWAITVPNSSPQVGVFSLRHRITTKPLAALYLSQPPPAGSSIITTPTQIIRILEEGCSRD